MTPEQSYEQKGYDGLSGQEILEYFFTKGDVVPRYSKTNFDIFLCYKKSVGGIYPSFRGIYTKSLGWVNAETHEPEVPEYYLDLKFLKRIESLDTFQKPEEHSGVGLQRPVQYNKEEIEDMKKFGLFLLRNKS